VAPQPEWKRAPVNWQPTDYLSPKATTDNSTIYHFTLSPNFATDHTIFASGVAADGCPMVGCERLFVSRDGGVGWQALPAVNMVGTQILLPPDFNGQADLATQRIFATGETQLQLSDTGGQTFLPLTLSSGAAVMSPAFASGDARILLADAPAREWNDDLHAVTPIDLPPSFVSASKDLSFAFPRSYNPAHPVLYVASRRVAGVSSVGTVARCDGGQCVSQGLPGLDDTPRLMVSTLGGADALYAYVGDKMYRSTDAGATFTRLALPPGTSGIQDLSADQGGNLLLVAANITSATTSLWRSTDGGTTWAAVPQKGIQAQAILTAAGLPDGTILVGLRGQYAGVACSHNGGVTWQTRC
jgi:hypothetical protein